jgi:chromosome segregation ATPase
MWIVQSFGRGLPLCAFFPGTFLQAILFLTACMYLLRAATCLQDTYKTETTSALQTLKSDHDTATSTCNQLTQQLAKQQADHTAELATLHEAHAAAHKEQQVIAEGVRQQLEAAQARATTAEEQLAASKAAAAEDAATITKLQANITGVCSAQMAWL